MKTTHHDTIIIAMDIDDFMTSMQVEKIREQAWRDPIHHSDHQFFTVEFDYKGVHYNVENVLTPGCVEFLCFLFEHEYVRPSFFSAGIRSRNLDLAEKVVQIAIDACGDDRWKSRYDVYSREDCFDTELIRHKDKNFRDQFQPEHFFGNLKKDLRMIHYGRDTYKEMVHQIFNGQNVILPNPEKDKDILKNLILVEEDASYLFPGQEKNMLLCPTYNHPSPHTVNYQGDALPTFQDFRKEQFQAANTIFYATGVLHRVFERLSENTTIPDILWQEQGHLWNDPKLYKDRFPLHFFTEGRDILQRYNASLNFAVPSQKVRTKDG